MKRSLFTDQRVEADFLWDRKFIYNNCDPLYKHGFLELEQIKKLDFEGL